jgi:hypothetical protein
LKITLHEAKITNSNFSSLFAVLRGQVQETKKKKDRFKKIKIKRPNYITLQEKKKKKSALSSLRDLTPMEKIKGQHPEAQLFC